MWLIIMAVYGHLSEFNTTDGVWDTYFEQLEFYLEANGITNSATKKAVFLSSCGDSCYRLFRNLITPDKPKDKNFDVEVEHNQQTKRLSLLGVPGKGLALLGRDWLSELKKNWHQIHAVKATVLMYLSFWINTVTFSKTNWEF